MTKWWEKWIKAALPLAFWLGVWQLFAVVVGQELLIPAPAAVANRLWTLGRTEEFWLSAGASLLRIFGGLGAGVVIGTLVGVLTSLWKGADWILSPAVRVVRAVPVASFIILVLLWVERNLVPGVISCLMVIPVVWGNVTEGIRQTDPKLLELAQAYAFGRRKTLTLVCIPSVRPYFASGVITAMGLAWKAGVAAEVICQPKLAIGTQVYYSRAYLETADLFAWTVVVVLLSMALEILLRRGLRRMGGGKG